MPGSIFLRGCDPSMAPWGVSPVVLKRVALAISSNLPDRPGFSWWETGMLVLSAWKLYFKGCWAYLVRWLPGEWSVHLTAGAAGLGWGLVPELRNEREGMGSFGVCLGCLTLGRLWDSALSAHCATATHFSKHGWRMISSERWLTNVWGLTLTYSKCYFAINIAFRAPAKMIPCRILELI